MREWASRIGTMVTKEDIDNLARGFMTSRIILTAVELDLFRVLEASPRDLEELSAALHSDSRGMKILADALVSLGLLQKRQGKYIAVPVAANFLSSGSREYRGGALRHLANLWNNWSRLTEVVKTGKVSQTQRTEAELESFIHAMEHVSKTVVDRTAEMLDLAGVRRVLDLGGGPGSFSIAMARRQPDLRVTILDLPHALRIARIFIEEAGLTDRIHLQKGDFFETNFGSGYDLILASSIIHSLDEKDNLTLLQKSKAALRSGGRIAIRDFLVERDHTHPPMAAIFAVNMLVNTRGGRTYSFEEITDWFQGLGMVDIRLQDIDGRSQLVTAVNPA